MDRVALTRGHHDEETKKSNWESSMSDKSCLFLLLRLGTLRKRRIHKDNLRHLPRFPDFFVSRRILSSLTDGCILSQPSVEENMNPSDPRAQWPSRPPEGVLLSSGPLAKTEEPGIVSSSSKRCQPHEPETVAR